MALEVISELKGPVNPYYSIVTFTSNAHNCREHIYNNVRQIPLL